MKKSFITFLFTMALFMTGTLYAQYPKYLYGIISIFGDDYAGKTTASGESYDPDKLTASHQTLPFGTELLIENLENGRKATVRIIDRGPLSDSRIMEVSREAADQLGFIKKGTVYSKVTLVKIGDNKMKTPEEVKPVSSSKSSAAPAPVAETSAPVTPQTSSAPSVSAVTSPVKQESGTAAPVQTKTEIITKTNISTLYTTNQVDVTNYSDLTVTNQYEIPPYEDKYIEMPVEDRKTGDTTAIKDEFILDEPVDSFAVADNKKTEVTSAPEPELPLVEEKTSPGLTELSGKDEPAETDTTVTEKPVEQKNGDVFTVPDTLSANEEAVNIEKNESQGEALLESGRQKGEFGLVVQAGAFRKEGNALRFYETLRKKGYGVFTSEAKVRGKKWFRVRIGYFNDLESAKKTIAQLKKSKIKAFLVKIKK